MEGQSASRRTATGYVHHRADSPRCCNSRGRKSSFALRKRRAGSCGRRGAGASGYNDCERAARQPIGSGDPCNSEIPTCLKIRPLPVPDFSHGDGLLPAIAQDADSGEVLMLAYMNAESYRETLSTGRAVYYSRSRRRIWRKGEESGHVQLVRSVLVDCDGDTILLKVQQIGGAACHEGYRSCFFREVQPEGLKTVAEPVFDPAAVYGAGEEGAGVSVLLRPRLWGIRAE